MQKVLTVFLLMLLIGANVCFAKTLKGNNGMKKIEQTAGRKQLEESVLSDKDKYQKTIMFPIGAPNDAYAKYFIGNSYIAPISTAQVKMFNVTFEPKCRNNWHIHHAKQGGGQMLIAVGGRGYYQEWGKKPVEMNPGDVINIPANVKHWHGAAPDSWFSHIAVEVEGVETSNEWLEAVSDEEYNKLK